MAILKDAHVYLPPATYKLVKASAEASRRSLTAEILFRLERDLAHEATIKRNGRPA